MSDFFQTFNLEAQAAVVLGGLLLASYVFLHTQGDPSDVDAPWAFGYLKYCPRFFSNALYAWNTVGIVESGYQRVCDFHRKILSTDSY